MICKWLCNWVLKLQGPFATHCNDHLQFIVRTIYNSLQQPFATHCNLVYFYTCECYQTSCMSCNGCNPQYVKLYTYVIHAIQLQICRNNYCATLMQLICNYNSNVMLMLFFIDPSKFDTWRYMDFWVKIIIF